GRKVPFSCPRDPFGMTIIVPARREEDAAKPIDTNAQDTAAIASMTLQAVVIGPGYRGAIINGKPIEQNEPTIITPGGPAVLLRRREQGQATLGVNGQLIAPKAAPPAIGPG